MLKNIFTRIVILFSFILLGLSVPAYASAVTYYVSPTGSDSNPGTSEASPWKTISKANSTNLNAGDQVLFQGGGSFSGSLNVTTEDDGTSSNPVIVSSYGTGKATIAGGSSYGILVDKADAVKITNLKVVGNCDPLTNTGNNEAGIQVLGGLTFSQIDNVEVSHFCREGIRLQDVTDGQITHSDVHDNAYRGIVTYGSNNFNTYIAYNHVYNNPGHVGFNSGDGIRVTGAHGAVIEYNVANNNGQNGGDSSGGPVGIWCYASTDVTIQFNESYGNRSSGFDGGGFDLDGGTTNSVIQYNYSHDNEGAGYLLAQYLGAPTFANNVIRYNISQNDGNDANHGGIHIWNGGSGITNTNIYHNIIYSSSTVTNPKIARSVYVSSGGVSNVTFRNNIFIAQDNNNDGDSLDARLVDGSGGMSGVTFQGNLYYAFPGTTFKVQSYTDLASWQAATGKETLDGNPTGVVGDPLLVNAGGAGTIGDPDLLPTQLPQLTQYKLLANSPVINHGLNLVTLFGIDPGTQDFFGSAIPQYGTLDIGASEYTGVTPSVSPSPMPTPPPSGCSSFGDLNGDCVVNAQDMSLLISQLLGMGSGDVDTNGKVNSLDAVIILSNF